MFTGIIEALGGIVSKQDNAEGAVLQVDLGGLELRGVQIGDSIAVNGVCLTVTEINDTIARFDVSPETLSKCLIGAWAAGDSVNLERALTLQKSLGGHLVSGHVDGTGELIERRDATESTRMIFETTREIGRYIARKGSISVDGISLTSNTVEDIGEMTRFEVTLVPHTLSVTTLGKLCEQDRVHLEIDLVARYLERMHESDLRAQK